MTVAFSEICGEVAEMLQHLAREGRLSRVASWLPKVTRPVGAGLEGARALFLDMSEATEQLDLCQADAKEPRGFVVCWVEMGGCAVSLGNIPADLAARVGHQGPAILVLPRAELRRHTKGRVTTLTFEQARARFGVSQSASMN